MRRPTPETTSHALALALTAAIALSLLLPNRHEPPPTDVNHPAIEIALAPEPVPAPARPVEPAPPEPAKPRPVIKKERSQHATAPAALPLMAETADLTSDLPAASSDPPSAPPAPAPAVAAGTIEAQYAETLRTNIDARTVPPTSIEYRLQRPKGETRVAFTLDRDGTVRSSAIARSSGSGLLDRQALLIVRTGRYPPFPKAAFQGESQHAFFVTLEFKS